MHKGQGKPSLSLNSSLSLPTSPLIPSLNFLPSLSLPPSLITSFFPHAFSFSLSLLTNISYLAKFLLKYPFPFIYPFLFTDLSSFPSLNSPPFRSAFPLPRPREDPYQWAYSVWWDRWFPEVLEECRRGEDVLWTGVIIRKGLGIQVAWLQSYNVHCLFPLSPSFHLPFFSPHLTAVAELYSESPLVKVASKPRPQGTRMETLVYQHG